MVSVLKGKKFVPRPKAGLVTEELFLIPKQNEGSKDGRLKKKKKMKKKSAAIDALTSASALSPGTAESKVRLKPKLKAKMKKKKIKCDKLLLNMLRKKRAKDAESNCESIVGEEVREDGSDNEVQSNETISPLKKKLKLSKVKRKQTVEDKVPLLLSPQEEDDSKKPKVNGILPHVPDLPITECRETFIQRFKENDTLIVVGETGCGKSTQIPKFLIQDCVRYFSNRGLAITQPRRVAAISLANRVSYELGATLGDLVGFKVRFDKQVSDATKITFMTDGYLMMDAIRDKLFNQYSVIIVDEAHERSVETDVLLSLLRNAQIHRKSRNIKKQLKLIIMSATMDVDKFNSFFALEEHGLSTKAVYVKGRPYSLQLNYLPRDVSESHIDLTWITLLKLHIELPVDHHILVFLTGKEEIDLVAARASAINHRKDLAQVYVCPLYAALSKEAQMKSFELPPENTRKIVVSTNLAETSLTIPGVRVVIDSGRVKSKYFEGTLGMNALRVQLISKSQANQRAGRAGREFEGSVYRIFTKKDYERMEEFPIPEIMRSNLSRVILLAAVSLGINNFKEFPLPDRPNNKAIRYALNELHRFGAIESNQYPMKLTRTARRLLSFPVELHLAKVLYLAVQYQELSRICAIVSMLTVESVYNSDIHMKESHQIRNQTFWAPEGDFITLWKIFKEYKKAANKKAWCREHNIQFRAMVYVVQVWRQLLTVCQEMELEDGEKLSCKDAVDFTDKAHLIFKTAFSHQIAKLSKTGGSYLVENQFDSSIKFPAKIHPSSSLVTRKPGRIMFTHLSLNEADFTVYMHNCGVL